MSVANPVVGSGQRERIMSDAAAIIGEACLTSGDAESCRRARFYCHIVAFRTIPGQFFRASCMNLHEYQSKALFAEYGIPTPRGRVATTAAEAEVLATGARRRSVGRQGAGACGRSGQGRRREAREIDCRGGPAREGVAWHAPRHASERTGRAARGFRLCRGGLRHRARALLEPGRRSQRGADRRDRIGVRRHGYRGGRARYAGKDLDLDAASGSRLAGLSGAQARFWPGP